MDGFLEESEALAEHIERILDLIEDVWRREMASDLEEAA